jgi:hypothetical protein
MGENGPSERAREAAYPRLLGWASVSEEGLRLIIDRVGEATHDSALGLGRSVCLAEVIALFADSGPIQTGKFMGERPGAVLDRVFTGPSSPEGETA